MDQQRYREAEERLWKSLGITPTERKVRLARSDVTVRVQEVGDGPPVIFVHGASSCGSTWAGLAARLQGFRCVIVDRPGAGLSDARKAPFGNIDDLATFGDEMLIDLMDAMDLNHAHVVATSFGGYFALRAAAARPDRFGRMVFFGWTAGAPVRPIPFFMRLGAVPALGRAMAAMPVNERIVRAMFRRIGLRQALEAGRISQEVIDCFVSLLRDTDTLRNEMAVNQLLMTLRKGLDSRIELADDVLRGIETPSYFLWGEEDPFAGADIARAFTGHMPNAKLEIAPGAGHAVWIDDPDHAAEVTTTFLTNSVPRTASQAVHVEAERLARPEVARQG